MQVGKEVLGNPSSRAPRVDSRLSYGCQSAFFGHSSSLSSRLTFCVLCLLPEEYFISPEHKDVTDPTVECDHKFSRFSRPKGKKHFFLR
jgi:hypothetical protein